MQLKNRVNSSNSWHFRRKRLLLLTKIALPGNVPKILVRALPPSFAMPEIIHFFPRETARSLALVW